jgi:hypothetical protein
MVDDNVLVHHRRYLLALVQWWDLFSCHGLIDHAGGGGRRSSIATHASSTLRVGCRIVFSDIAGMVSFTRHGGVESGEAQSAMNESRKVLKAGVRNDRTWRAQ